MRILRQLTILSTAGALALAGCVATSKAAPANHSVASVAGLTKNGRPISSLADVVQKVLPSVVAISSTRIRRVERPSSPFFNDPFFQRFFGPMQHGPREFKQQGLGSGVVVKGGYILTNNHVIAGADEIRVTSSDKHQYKVKLVGADPKSDLAVLKIEGNEKGLVPVAWGDSTKLRLGDVVLAIGNPFGVGETVTQGIVSAKGRADLGIEEYEDFIQTDAAINPGNSGGALINTQGQLVGINTAIYSRSGGSMGIGFAIPSEMAKPIMKSLVAHGRVIRGWLGIEIQDVTRDLADAMKLPSPNGVLVSSVSHGSPGAKAGLKGGDVILEVQGQAVNSTGQLRNAVASAGAGAKVKLLLIRNGKRMTLNATLGEMPTKTSGAQENSSNGAQSGNTLSGLDLEPLDSTSRSRLKVPDSIKGGVVVNGVEDGSPAVEAGLRPGDVIHQVNRKDVSNVADAERAWKNSKGPVLLLVFHDGFDRFVVVKP